MAAGPHPSPASSELCPRSCTRASFGPSCLLCAFRPTSAFVHTGPLAQHRSGLVSFSVFAHCSLPGALTRPDPSILPSIPTGPAESVCAIVTLGLAQARTGRCYCTVWV